MSFFLRDSASARFDALTCRTQMFLVAQKRILGQWHVDCIFMFRPQILGGFCNTLSSWSVFVSFRLAPSALHRTYLRVCFRLASSVLSSYSTFLRLCFCLASLRSSYALPLALHLLTQNVFKDLFSSRFFCHSYALPLALRLLTQSLFKDLFSSRFLPFPRLLTQNLFGLFFHKLKVLLS